MKIFLTTTMALGAMCILETNQPANATVAESVSSNIHLVRGGHRGREAAGEGRAEEGRAEEGRAEEGRAEEAPKDSGEAGRNTTSPTTDQPAVDRMHSIENSDISRNLNNGGWGDDGGWTVLCPNGTDKNGNCL